MLLRDNQQKPHAVPTFRRAQLCGYFKIKLLCKQTYQTKARVSLYTWIIIQEIFFDKLTARIKEDMKECLTLNVCKAMTADC